MSHQVLITERQHAHLQGFLAAYAIDHGETYADMSRRVPGLGVGSIAGARRKRPAVRLVKRLMAAYGWTEEELLGPPEPLEPAPFEFPPLTLPGPLAHHQDDLFASSHGQQCLTILQASHELLQSILRRLDAILDDLDTITYEGTARTPVETILHVPPSP